MERRVDGRLVTLLKYGAERMFSVPLFAAGWTGWLAFSALYRYNKNVYAFLWHTERKKTMRKINRWIALLLAMLLLPVFSLAEGEESPVTHTARTTATLKVRRAPDDSALGSDSIPRDSIVYIIEYGDLWCKVRTSRTEGYIKTKYLTDLLVADVSAVQAQEEKAQAEAVLVGEVQPGFTMNKSNFQEKFYAYAVKDRVVCVN